MSPATAALIIFGIVVVLFLWNRIPMSVVALGGLAAMTLAGVISFGEAFKSFGSTTGVHMCSMMILGKATYDTGLAHSIGKLITARAKNSEKFLLLVSLVFTCIVSAFMSNIATIAMMITVLGGICADHKDIHFMNLILPVSIAAIISGTATLSGAPTQLTAMGVVSEMLGREYSFFTFLRPSCVLCILLILYCIFCGYPLGKKLWGSRPEYEETSFDLSSGSPVGQSRKKQTVMAVIFVVTFVLYALCDSLKQWIPALNYGLIGLCSALACVLTGCIGHKEAVKAVNWELMLWFCASLGLAAGLEQSGAGELIATGFIRLFGENVSPGALFAAVIVLAVIMTQFLANSTVVAIVLPIVISITQRLGLDAYSFSVGVTIASATAVATPIANGAIGMSMVGKYKFSDFVLYAGPYTVLATLVLIFLVPALWPL